MAGGRTWTPEEDAILRGMVGEGREYKKIGRKLKRTTMACRLRASFLGLKQSKEAILANRQRGRERFFSNPKKAERWRERVARQFTPQDRAIRAEELRQRNIAGTMGLKGRHHSPEARAKISAAHKGRPNTPEQNRKIAKARKAYWAAWRAAPRRDRLDEYLAEDAANIWCLQCERRVTADQARACMSRFCKAKAMAA